MFSFKHNKCKGISLETGKRCNQESNGHKYCDQHRCKMCETETYDKYCRKHTCSANIIHGFKGETSGMRLCDWCPNGTERGSKYCEKHKCSKCSKKAISYIERVKHGDYIDFKTIFLDYCQDHNNYNEMDEIDDINNKIKNTTKKEIIVC